MKGRDSVISLFYRRFIICTPAKTGLGEKVSNVTEQTSKLTLKQKKDSQKQLIKNSFPLLMGVGGAVVLSFAFFASGIGQAKAADSLPSIDLARNVVRNIAPVISASPVDDVSASLVFAPEGYLNKPLIAETQITKVERPLSSRPTATAVKVKKTATKISPNVQDVGSNRFPYGYCTYYAAGRRFVPWSGNAISWLAGARSFGFATGNTPQVGAIVVTSEGGKTGHVAVVDYVNGGEITVSEMNYRGFGVISSRTISADYGRILGYIY